MARGTGPLTTRDPNGSTSSTHSKLATAWTGHRVTSNSIRRKQASCLPVCWYLIRKELGKTLSSKFCPWRRLPWLNPSFLCLCILWLQIYHPEPEQEVCNGSPFNASTDKGKRQCSSLFTNITVIKPLQTGDWYFHGFNRIQFYCRCNPASRVFI